MSPTIYQAPSKKWRAVVKRAGVGKGRWSQSFNTKSAAGRWVLQVEDKLDRGIDPDTEQAERAVTVGEWEARWWAARVVEQTTRAANRSRLDNHVLPEWRDVELGQVKPLQVQKWVRRLEQNGMGAATVGSCHQLLSGMLGAAVREGLIPANPCQHTRLPKAPRGRDVYLSREQVDRLAEAMTADRDRLLVLLLAYTGLRWGEATGLRVGQIDLLRRRIEVVRVETRFGPKEYPKSDAGRRLVGLPEFLCDEIAAYLGGLGGRGLGIHASLRSTQESSRPTHLPDGLQPSGPARSQDRNALLFQTRDGKPLDDRHWRRRQWAQAVKKAKLTETGVRPHDLRHTYASFLVQAGIDMGTVRLLLGHHDLRTTLRYAHWKPDHGVSAVAVLERAPTGARSAF